MVWFNFAQPKPLPPVPQPKPAAAMAKGAPPAPGMPGAKGNVPVEDDLLEEEEDDNEAGKAMQAIVPWAVSILAHAAMVLIAILWVWATVTQKLDEEEPIIPIATLSERPGAQTTVRTTNTPTSASQQKRSLEKTEQVVQKLTTSPVKVDQSLIGVQSASGESKASPFGNATVGSGPFGVGMFGSGGNAKRIAYVIDASGSLIDTLPFVVAELRNSVFKLSEAQFFHIIFFTEGGIKEVPPNRLKPVSSESRATAFKWIEDGAVVPGGQAGTGPIEAVKKALFYQPDLVILLSDNITGQGRYELSQPELLAAIKAANKNKTKINTIQFLYPDPLTRFGGKSTLQLISQESGGVYKFVSGRELGLVAN